MKRDGEDWVFASGRTRYGFTEKLGIEHEGDRGWSISYGSDGGFWNEYELRDEWTKPEDKLTIAELTELAEHQIAKWQEFKQWLSDSAEATAPDQSQPGTSGTECPAPQP